MNIIQLLFGILFFAFLPGYLIVRIWFSKEEELEKIILSVVFSIMIAIAIGIFFGYDRTQALRTGGFTTTNIWLGELAVTGFLAVIFIIKQTLLKKKPLPTSKVKVSKQHKPSNKHSSTKKSVQTTLPKTK